MDDQMTEYITLQRIAEAAGVKGSIFMRNTDDGETFMLMLDGDELTTREDLLRREPVMVFLSELNTGQNDDGASPRLLTVTQTIRYQSDAADTIAASLYDWQNLVFSTGCVQDEDEGYIVLKSAFPIRLGGDLPVERIFAMAVADFRRETAILLDMIREKYTGDGEA